jgi:hypothetical protein
MAFIVYMVITVNFIGSNKNNTNVSGEPAAFFFGFDNFHAKERCIFVLFYDTLLYRDDSSAKHEQLNLNRKMSFIFIWFKPRRFQLFKLYRVE